MRDSGQPRALSTDALVLLLGSKSVTALVVMLIESAAELAEHLRAEADRYAANLAFEPEKSITCVSVPANKAVAGWALASPSIACAELACSLAPSS